MPRFPNRNKMKKIIHHSSSLVSANSVATEPAVFELACVLNNVKHVVICGHSDCKAVNLLYDLHTDPNAVNPTEFSPLRSWVRTHGARSMTEFFRIEQVKNIADSHRLIILSFYCRLTSGNLYFSISSTRIPSSRPT